MSEQEFESYLRLLGRFLRLSDSQRETIGRELRDHMEERLAELLDDGHSREEAINIALDEFGDAAALASDFGRIGRRRKWIMRTTAGTLGVAAAVLIVSLILPENQPGIPAPTVTQADESFSTAVGGRDSAIKAASAVGETEADRETRRQLLARMDFKLAQSTTLEKAFEYLQTQADVSITVNWSALEFAGIDRDVPVGGNMNFSDVSLKTVLELILDNVAQVAGGIRLDYVIVDGIIRVSTEDDLGQWLVVRIYDCQDLIDRPLTGTRQAMIEAIVKQIDVLSAGPPVPPGGMLGVSAFGKPSSMGGEFDGKGGVAKSASEDAALRRLDEREKMVYKVAEALRKRNAADFVQLIQDMVSPETWIHAGGLGSISEYDGLVVIRSSMTVHRETAELLEMLRQALAARPAAVGSTRAGSGM